MWPLCSLISSASLFQGTVSNLESNERSLEHVLVPNGFSQKKKVGVGVFH